MLLISQIYCANDYSNSFKLFSKLNVAQKQTLSILEKHHNAEYE